MQRTRSKYNDVYDSRGMSRGGRSHHDNEYSAESYNSRLAEIEANYNERYYEICNDSNMSDDEKHAEIYLLDNDTLQEVDDLNAEYSYSSDYDSGQGM